MTLQAPDLSTVMGALAQGPAVAKGGDFVKTKLVARNACATTAPRPSNPTPGPSNAPGPSTAPGSSTATTHKATKQPLRILKLSPTEFAEVKRAKLEREAKAEMTKVGVKEAKGEDKVVAKVSEAPSPALQPQNTFMASFPFPPFMSNQSFFPTNTEGQEGSSTVMWQAMYGATIAKK